MCQMAKQPLCGSDPFRGNHTPGVVTFFTIMTFSVACARNRPERGNCSERLKCLRNCPGAYQGALLLPRHRIQRATPLVQKKRQNREIATALSSCKRNNWHAVPLFIAYTFLRRDNGLELDALNLVKHRNWSRIREAG